MGMKDTIRKLISGSSLEKEEAYHLMLQIGKGQLDPIEISSILTAMAMRNIRVTELDGFRMALLELAVPVRLRADRAIDIVGTGGDGKNTFNISTLSSFVVAGAGYKVIKHGNTGVSSSSGSSDVLRALGYVFSDDPVYLQRQLDELNICFLHAPLWHPAMRYVAPVRRKLGVKTIFNMLGPLVNPAQPVANSLGVYHEGLGEHYQKILSQNPGPFHVVYDEAGYDEVSLTGPVRLFSKHGVRTLGPRDFGFEAVDPLELHGGHSVESAADLFLRILQNKSTIVQQQVVAANAGLAIYTLNDSKSLKECVSEAYHSIRSGQALEVLEKAIGLISKSSKS